MKIQPIIIKKRPERDLKLPSPLHSLPLEHDQPHLCESLTFIQTALKELQLWRFPSLHDYSALGFHIFICTKSIIAIFLKISPLIFISST